ncbi:pyridoxamine 5'-phosphate oxidase [soil metagenome]
MSVDPAIHRALAGACAFADERLPENLPPEPLATFQAWLAYAAASKSQPNPNAFALATVAAHAAPSVRIVLARRLHAELGAIVFFTNAHSHKGSELQPTAPDAPAHAAACFHWDHLSRQVRIQGPVTPAPARESDEYFASRPRASQIAAWASDQSAPIASRAALLAKFAAAEQRFAGAREVPRPPHWGGFRLWIQSIELWHGDTARLHDRALWTRTLAPAQIEATPGFRGGPWTATRLQP